MLSSCRPHSIRKEITMPRTHAITAAFVLFVFGVVARASADQVTAWNELGAQAAVAAGQSIPVSRTLAMAQIAVHDALNAIDPRYEPYVFRGTYPGASIDAAVATAAHHALVFAIATGVTIPGFGTLAGQAAAVSLLDQRYAEALAAIPDGASKNDGIAAGAAAAAAVIALRRFDGATALVPYT